MFEKCVNCGKKSIYSVKRIRVEDDLSEYEYVMIIIQN